jgi:ankyrin repeat protein
VDWALLHLAAFEGKVEAVLVLLKHGANVDVHNKNGETLFQVTVHRRVDIVCLGLITCTA